MSSTYIIAEAGVNHNGDVVLAKQLVDAAKKAGADAVKFQTFKAENLVTVTAKQAAYQIKNTGMSESQFAMLKRLELSEDAHHSLVEYCNEKEIQFLSSAFDLESIAFLDQLGMPIFKIPSGELTNSLYLHAVAALKKPVILSTGMATLDEMKDAVDRLKCNGLREDQITVLHCTTEYPAPMETVNLRVMHTIRDALHTNVGYSDHTEGIEVPIAAVALGATIIEKHMTLDKTFPGPDHKSSLEPAEFAAMVQCIRNIESALGNGNKVVSEIEKQNSLVARKSIVAKVPIKKGEILSEDNMTVKRPGYGISPMSWDNVLGGKAIRDFEIDELIDLL